MLPRSVPDRGVFLAVAWLLVALGHHVVTEVVD